MVLESNGLHLDIGQADVWLTQLSSVGDDLQHKYLQLLSESEYARWQGFIVRGARLQYLVSRALLRTTLSHYADVPPNAWCFETNHFGRPYVSWPVLLHNVQFSLSHTAGLVACAIAKDCSIGLDVENTQRELDFAAMASYFSPAEAGNMARRSREDQREYFFFCWTLKEAYAKAKGMGLSLPFDGFWFDLDGSSPRIHFTDRCDDDPLRWSFHLCAPTNDHKLALAISAPIKEVSIHLHWVIPLA
jgi:4'-phosphopantetheinyl transferase